MIATRTARAVWFPAARRVELREEPVGEPGAGEVLVRALASGVSQGTEMLVYRGEVPAGLPLDLPTLRGGFGFPVKYGYASVGRVLAVGEGVDWPRPGEVVFVHHPHQSAYVVDASLCLPVPEGVSPEVATLLANLETAVNVALDAHPRLGDRVVVIGQGVVGLLAGALLRRAGVGLLVAVDPVESRRALATRLGADVVLAPDAATAQAVAHLTAGAGADVVVEASGSPAALQAALDCAGFQGTVVVCSWYGSKPVPVMLGDNFHRGRLRVVSSQVGSVDPALSPRWDLARRRSVALEMLATLDLAPLVTHRFPVEQAAQAYALLDSGAGDAVQLVLTYGDDV